MSEIVNGIPSNQTAVLSAIAAESADVTLIKGYTDTEVADIKTQTDKITAISSKITELYNNDFPLMGAEAPRAEVRVGYLQCTTAANNENIVVDGITYTFKTALGTPAASNVEIKVQGTVAATIALFAQATRGIVDVANIAYGSGVGANPIALGYFTTKKLCREAGQLLAGSNVFFLEIALDAVTAITFTTTTTGTLNAFVRVFTYQYTFELNSTGVPSDWALLSPLYFGTGFDAIIHGVSVEDQSSALTNKEFDIAYSPDEITFTKMGRGYSCNNSSKSSLKVPVTIPQVAAGINGTYIRFRSSGSSNSETINFKISVTNHIS